MNVGGVKKMLSKGECAERLFAKRVNKLLLETSV